MKRSHITVTKRASRLLKMIKQATLLSASGLLLLPALSSCNHKDLCYEHNHNAEVNLVFDWRNAPDADPSSMAAVMFDRNLTNDPIRFIFTGRDGGKINLPLGQYDAIGLNADLNDWANFRNQPDIESVELYTNDADRLEAYNLMPESVPRSRGTESERMASTPNMVWSARTDSIVLDDYDTSKTITIYPEEVVCHYTVTILDVENIENAKGEVIDGTLSGMAEGYKFGKHCATDEIVTHPFTLAVDSSGNVIDGAFLTFGECPLNKQPHILTIYLFLSDGSKWYYNFDVTDQVTNAPDPKHVDIVVRGLSLPRPLQSDAGLHPDVNDWQTETIDINM